MSYEIKESKGVRSAKGDRAHDIGFDTVDQFLEVLMKDVVSVYHIVPVSEPGKCESCKYGAYTHCFMRIYMSKSLGTEKGAESDGLLDMAMKERSFLSKGALGLYSVISFVILGSRS